MSNAKVNLKETSTERSTQAPRTLDVSGSEAISIFKPTLVKEDPLPLDSSELSYADRLLEASNNGLIPVRLEEDVVIQRISHDLYSDPKSGFRELYNNEARACRIARKNHGARPRIEVTIAPSSRKLVIHGIDSTGMSQHKFLTVYTVLGRSDNFDSSEVGMFGLGRASYTCLSDIMVLETYSRDTQEKYAVMGKNGIGYNVLPQPADLEQYGTRITVTLRSDINIRSLVGYVFEVCRFSGVDTIINLEEDVKGLYDRELVKAGQYRTGLESMKEHVQKSRKGDSYHEHTPLVQVEIDDSDYYLYGEITARKYSWQSAADELGREERVGVYLLGTPTDAGISLPLSFWILNVKDERKYPPTADRERLTEAAEKQVREMVMASLREKLSSLLRLESPADYATSQYRMLYLQHDKLDGLSDCLDERTKKVVEFVNTRVKVWERYNGRRSRGTVRIGSLLRRHHGDSLFCVANLTAAAAEALEQNVPGALVFEGYISELLREFGVRDGDQYVKENGLKRFTPPPNDEVTVYRRRWGETQTTKVNAADIDDTVIKVPVGLRDEYVRLMDGLDVKYRIAVDAKSGRNKKLLEGRGITLADFVKSVGKKAVTTSEGQMTIHETLELSKEAETAPVLFKYDDASLAEHLKQERAIAVVVPDDDSMYELQVFYRYAGIHATKGESLYECYGKYRTLAGVDMCDLKGGDEDRHAILHAYHTLRPVDQHLFELLACAIVGHGEVRTDMSVRQMREYVFSLAGLDRGEKKQGIACRTGTRRSGRK
jgi:hypothetical protein